MSNHLNIETDSRGVCTITLNRADKHNAFNAEVIDQLTSALVNISKQHDVRVVVLTGDGPSFSSGADLEWMRDAVNYDQARNQKDAIQLAVLMETLSDLPIPTIARINGAAFGGGLGLIACCDIAICVDSALFSFSEVRLGLVPAIISPYILMAVGPRQAKKLFMTGERFDAARALELQLLHEVVAADGLDQAVEKTVAQLLKGGPQALAACKRLVPRLNNDQINMELAALIATLRAGPEGQEGLNAFLEKRPPAWIAQNTTGSKS